MRKRQKHVPDGWDNRDESQRQGLTTGDVNHIATMAAEEENRERCQRGPSENRRDVCERVWGCIGVVRVMELPRNEVAAKRQHGCDAESSAKGRRVHRFCTGVRAQHRDGCTNQRNDSPHNISRCDLLAEQRLRDEQHHNRLQRTEQRCGCDTCVLKSKKEDEVVDAKQHAGECGSTQQFA